MLDALLQGTLLGGYYAILAAGLSLMFGVARFINLAHGDIAILGAFIVLLGVEYFNMSPWFAMIGAIPIMYVLGWLTQKYVFDRTQRGGFLLPLLTTFGLAAVIQNGLFAGFGSDIRSLADYIGDLSWDSWDLTDEISVGKLPVIVFVIAVVTLVGLQLVLSLSRFGRAVRATALDPEAAQLCGIDSAEVYRKITGIAFVLSAIAGVMLTMRASIAPYSGPAQLIFAFEAVVIGGIGSLWGTLLGGIALGVAQSVGAFFDPQWFQLAGHSLFLLVLGVRFLNQKALHVGGWRAYLSSFSSDKRTAEKNITPVKERGASQ
ncbi:branched-chain amino acid ABC transporter permease [Marinomonas mediterranea]|uniref:branched-chain amino acid ABC transporter permease n=1 Tax=Marinomonas mediterranea TaxID=119864 RepID=UPI00234B6978|nr:branched-chain amino acid ABC transporter permease [Marinomonas mediterranea]WCN14900.1 branched-chain amino acid ABC transporter permease [Marinomonas mediterranea]